jgi:uncharacterized membrane protein
MSCDKSNDKHKNGCRCENGLLYGTVTGIAVGGAVGGPIGAGIGGFIGMAGGQKIARDTCHKNKK